MTEALTAQVEGNEQKRLDSLNAAIASYDAVLSVDADHVQALNGRGICKEQIEEGRGKADLERVVEISTSKLSTNKADAGAYHDRATALRSLKRYDEARADYKKAIEIHVPGKNELIDKKAKWELDLKAMELEAK